MVEIRNLEMGTAEIARDHHSRETPSQEIPCPVTLIQAVVIQTTIDRRKQITSKFPLACNGK